MSIKKDLNHIIKAFSICSSFIFFFVSLGVLKNENINIINLGPLSLLAISFVFGVLIFGLLKAIQKIAKK